MCVPFAHMMRIPKIPCFFVPKYRRPLFYGEKRLKTGECSESQPSERHAYYGNRRVFRSVIFICYRGCRPNIPSIQLRTVSKAKEVCQYISVVERQGISIATGNFGAKGITSISRGRILKRYIRNQLKKDAGQNLLTPDFAPFTGAGQPSFCQGVMPLRRLPAQSGHFRI